jgi:hypothetical protein
MYGDSGGLHPPTQSEVLAVRGRQRGLELGDLGMTFGLQAA